MIIGDDEPTSPSKSQRALHYQDAAQDVPPPAYTGPPTPTRPQDPHAGPSSPLLDPNSQLEKREPATRRFWKAFAVAVLVYALLAMLVQSSITIRRPSTHKGTQPIRGHPQRPAPRDGKVVECRGNRVHWSTSDGFVKQTSFQFLMPTKGLYFMAHGSSNGRLDVVQDTDWTLRDIVKVDISLLISHTDLDNVAVCLMERSEGERGIVLLAPDEPTLPASATFTLKVRLPPSVEIAPMYIPSFETALPGFFQHIGDLHDDVVFGTLALASTNGMISAQSVFAEDVIVITSSGAIEGDFFASHLELMTSNGAIKANITVDADPSVETSIVRLKSSNGEIHSSVNMLSTQDASDTTGAAFDVLARTTNAVLELAITDLPLGADICIGARTSNHVATLRLPHAFEGDFQMRTTNARPYVDFASSVADPMGEGRERHLYQRMVGGNRLVGAVGWGSPPRGLDGSAVAREEYLWEQELHAQREGHAARHARQVQHLHRMTRGRDRVGGSRPSGTGWPGWDVDRQEWDGAVEERSVGRRLNSSAQLITSNAPAHLDLT